MTKDDHHTEPRVDASLGNALDVAIVACGVMKNEIKALQDQGWLDAGKVLYTPPGLHQDPEELERHLVRQVFKGWDKARANENFPRHEGGAQVLDATGFMDRYMEEHPEEFLDYCHWMGLPMYGVPTTLDRFKGLLLEVLQTLTSDKTPA